MSYNRRVKGRGLPAWLVFLMAIALVFGGYYLWIGARDFLRTGGLGIEEATSQAQIVGSATARREATRPASGGGDVFGVTQQPTITPIPPCEEFVVTAATGILRSDPTVRGNILNTLDEGTTVCVVGTEAVGEWVWYKIDTNPLTRRLDLGYMREDVIAPLNPTLTPSQTFTTAPTVTEMPTLTPSLTFTRTPTPTRDPRDTDTPEPTLTPTPTPPLQNV